MFSSAPPSFRSSIDDEEDEDDDPVAADMKTLHFYLTRQVLATLVVAMISLDGRSTWLEGLQLLGVYVILAVSFYYVGPA